MRHDHKLLQHQKETRSWSQRWGFYRFFLWIGGGKAGDDERQSQSGGWGDWWRHPLVIAALNAVPLDGWLSIDDIDGSQNTRPRPLTLALVLSVTLGGCPCGTSLKTRYRRRLGYL